MNAPQPISASKADALEALKILRHYIGREQLLAISIACRGEEKQFFFDKLCQLAQQVSTMPKVYEQEGLGDSAIAHLHYFYGPCDWLITERDISDEQHQAYGLADLGFGPERGYISIAELLENGAELDLHFQPKPLKEFKAED
jgi:hypothetical protein